jgi:hypothetical protein
MTSDMPGDDDFVLSFRRSRGGGIECVRSSLLFKSYLSLKLLCSRFLRGVTPETDMPANRMEAPKQRCTSLVSLKPIRASIQDMQPVLVQIYYLRCGVGNPSAPPALAVELNDLQRTSKLTRPTQKEMQTTVVH